MPIVIKIDVTKVDKSRLFAGKNGAMYLDIVLLDSKNDKYGNDYMAIQSVSKEDREKGIKGPILGNGKRLGGNAPRQGHNRPPSHMHPEPFPDEDLDSDLPF